MSLSIEQAASQLELHPADLIRILVELNRFSEDLQVAKSDLERVRSVGHLQVWWTPADNGDTLTLSQRLLRIMLDAGLVHPKHTRADNLFRGLRQEARPALRRVVNTLIREEVLHSQMGTQALMVGIHPNAVDDVRQFIKTGQGRVLSLCQQGSRT